MLKTLTLDIMRKIFVNFLFIPTMLIGTIDLYHFIPLLVTFTLTGGHKVSTKQNLLASFCCTLSNKLIRMKFDVVLKHCKLNNLKVLFSEIQ